MCLLQMLPAIQAAPMAVTLLLFFLEFHQVGEDPSWELKLLLVSEWCSFGMG